ncbi:unnamed protein product [Fusarium graminearum]|uniref:Nuclear membrane fusion protein Kar5 n=1 Tax=Gibberella zeae TaxID=5518 RepID=A0A2H3GMW1_GIBZA|nr:hypothetical protein FG05_09307 [Fusarium graminearum]PCD32055.1 hypothetical protein FGRA07_09307 [Fusarium graminearum]CAF3627046.1 unnamed protein product [Fusarium graminearum]CAF3643099.1 unnamed protein product [Fusarium graminearum]CAG1965554.1 unnamed protein product [Fusarium graminearum]
MTSKGATIRFWGLTFLCFFSSIANCFSWRPHTVPDGTYNEMFIACAQANVAIGGDHFAIQQQQRGDSSSLWMQHADGKISNVYSTALQELQDLESQPLCHRIAARQLVNNCHLLDGQDDAKVHLDSGRAARDFVDFYAASLAICDLERGSFMIPKSCFKFREPFLAALPVPTSAKLHVSTNEIDDCLEGLAQSDSAWNTWVSYRHKALRFCDAARVDNQKDENIFLYQRITKILEKLTNDVEADLEKRFQSLNRAFDAASQSVESIGPQAKHLQMEMDKASRILRNDLGDAIQDSRDIVTSGLEEAQALHDLLAILVRALQENTADITTSQEVALRTSTDKWNTEIGGLVTGLTAMVATSLDQMETTAARSADILVKQARIEQGMDKLEELADDLVFKYDSYESRLDDALQKSSQVLDVLEATAASAAGLQGYMLGGLGFSGFWPYIVCPALSLAMGSYRLEPSLLRNIWLVGIGELMGVIVSKASYYANIFSSAKVFEATTDLTLNQTFPATAWEVAY